MLCSECNKNPAILFYKKIENGKESLEGYCYDCAKKKGINPTEVLHDQNNILSNDKININDMTKQFETIFKDLAENINLEDIENLDGAITFESQEQNPDSDEPSKISGAAIPLGSIFSNMFSNKASKSNSDESEELNDGRRKVKVEKKKNKKQNKKKKFLDTFGTNLTDKAKNNELDIVIGREKEIQRIVQILNRRSKNNPCLIGEPGVGKTAIAQGLAIKIANQNVPAKLLNKEVYLLDMTAVIAGTQFRGQFESRMKGIIDECKEYGNIILVIDEIHNIIGAGDGEHSMNAANILKPALSNGEIQLIGTTTLKEYRKYIEKDSALERRFQQVLVEEPNIEDSIVILEGIKKYYEEYGLHFMHASDEWYITAGRDFPEEERYDGYIQLENGVGMMRLFITEFTEALEQVKSNPGYLKMREEVKRTVTIATGKLTYATICSFAERMMEAFPGLQIHVFAIRNDFFGETITVSGLITGQDLTAQIKEYQENSRKHFVEKISDAKKFVDNIGSADKNVHGLGEDLIIPCNMLRTGERVFLDDWTVEDVEQKLGMRLIPIESGGGDFVEAILNPEYSMERTNDNFVYVKAYDR